jgi:hypothetical protein
MCKVLPNAGCPEQGITYASRNRIKNINTEINIGTIDKVIRILVAVTVVILYFSNIITGTLGIILLILSAIFVVTSLLSFCLIYLPFGISTRKKE